MKTTLIHPVATEDELTCDTVSKIPLLEKYCTPSQKTFLNEKVVYCCYRKNNLIFHENFPESNIFFIESGIIALWKENVFSKKQYLRFIKEGEFFGYRGGAIENSTYRLSASAFEDSKVHCIPKKDFTQVLNENPELHLNIILTCVIELEKTETNFCCQLAMNTREKVAEALLRIHDIFGCKKNSACLGEEVVPFSKSVLRKDIADIAGISTGKTINQLAEFRSEKIIDTCGSMITLLQLNKLNDIVEKFHH